MNLIALFILLRWERKAHSTGQVFGFALMLHGAARYIYEFWRAGTQAEVDAGKASSSYLANFPITEAQAAALLVMIVGLAVMLAVNRPGYVQQEIPA
jgi:prolipoprotein diacylglyceryltransferase